MFCFTVGFQHILHMQKSPWSRGVLAKEAFRWTRVDAEIKSQVYTYDVWQLFLEFNYSEFDHFKYRKIHELNEILQPLRQSGRGRLPLAAVLSRQRYFTFSVHLITCPANIQLWYPCRQWYCLPFCPLISHSWKIVVWQRCLAKFGCAIVNSFSRFCKKIKIYFLRLYFTPNFYHHIIPN